MGAKTKIPWCNHTFSPWLGCSPISESCQNCYARAIAKRFYKDVIWGNPVTYRRTSEAYWKQPLVWNKKAEKLGVRYRVFPSMCDPFDDAVPQQWFDDFIALALDCENLDFLLLTKRPQNIRKRFEAFCYPSLIPDAYMKLFWLGVTCENQATADERIPILLSIPAKVRFLSCEPLLGNIALEPRWVHGVHWLIAGGESGANARPMQMEWALDLRNQCKMAGVPFFFKQGSQNNWNDFKNFDSFPKELQIREFPKINT